jgi:hypothetical protein
MLQYDALVGRIKALPRLSVSGLLGLVRQPSALKPDIRLGFGLFPLVEVFIQHFETSVPYVQALHWEFAAHERQHATESEMDGRPPSTRSLPK